MVSKVAIAGGTGGLGSFITHALLDRKAFQVTLLTRTGTTETPEKKKLIDDFKAKGAHIAAVNFEDSQSIQHALNGIEVVVSAVTSEATGAQQRILADACKAAGVKVFMPSEFGLDSSDPRNHDIGLVKPKVETADYCKSIGLRTVRVMSGFFIDTFFLPWFGFDAEKGTAVVVGDGNTKFSLTHRKDVGRFVAQIIADQDFHDIVSLSAQELTINEAFAAWEKANGKKLQVTYEDLGAVEKRVLTAADPWVKTIDGLKLAIGKGFGLNTKNVIKPKDFTPITVADYFKSPK